MTTIPSPFGSPVETPRPVEPEQPATRRPSTLVLAVGAGVVALGILGGAAALVLGPGDEAAAPAVPAAVPVLTPTTEPVEEPLQPLPTAVSRARNVFVPLIAAAAGEEEAGEDASAGPVGAGTAGGGTSATPVTPVTPVTSVGGGGSVVGSTGGTAAVASSSAELQVAKDRIALLQTQIAQLQAQLVTASDDSVLQQQVAALIAQKDSLNVQVGGLQERVSQYEEADASRLLLEVVSADGSTLIVRAAGTDYPVQLGGDPVQVSSTSDGVPLTVRYLSFTDVADPGRDEVRLTYVDDTYTVSVGATLHLPR
jgi:hypothetical protein